MIMDKVLLKRIEELKLNHEETHKYWIVALKSVKSVLQKGPQCGLVALCMALNYKGIECTTQELFDQAVSLSFTKQGELFDIEFLENLAFKYNLKCKIFDLITNDDLIKWIVTNHIVLIPYDCDLNHEPCLKNGHKAHWCLIAGYMCPHQNEDLVNIDSNYEYSAEAHEFYCICMHGKSQFKTLWKLDSLVKSNQQLNEVGPLRNRNEYLLPEKSIKETLNSKFLVIFD